MPHIFVEDFRFNANDRFNFLASSSEADLIGVNIDDEEFLLVKKFKDSRYLIKYDKITRGANLSTLKRALNLFASDMNLNLLQSNISNQSESKEIEELKDVRFFIDEFDYNKYKKIYIEIGFGTGRHLLYRANEQKDALFIGIEVYKPSIETLYKHIKLQGIDNILMLNYDARLFLEILKSNSIDAIYVHFPVPWDKKPHRRVFSKEFVDEAIRVLKVDGRLELRSDSKEYFDYSLNLFLALRDVDFEVSKNKKIAITSKYEDRWLRANKDIYDLILKNREFSDEKSIDFDFEFDIKNINFQKILENFRDEIIRGDDFIVHFEKIFKIDNISGLIRLTLGNSSRPEQKYIFIKDSNVRYFKDKPMFSNANFKAHNSIKEWLQNGK